MKEIKEMEQRRHELLEAIRTLYRIAEQRHDPSQFSAALKRLNIVVDQLEHDVLGKTARIQSQEFLFNAAND